MSQIQPSSTRRTHIKNLVNGLEFVSQVDDLPHQPEWGKFERTGPRGSFTAEELARPSTVLFANPLPMATIAQEFTLTIEDITAELAAQKAAKKALRDAVKKFESGNPTLDECIALVRELVKLQGWGNE